MLTLPYCEPAWNRRSAVMCYLSKPFTSKCHADVNQSSFHFEGKVHTWAYSTSRRKSDHLLPTLLTLLPPLRSICRKKNLPYLPTPPKHVVGTPKSPEIHYGNQTKKENCVKKCSRVSKKLTVVTWEGRSCAGTRAGAGVSSCLASLW